jgi:hypothetical protein
MTGMRFQDGYRDDMRSDIKMRIARGAGLKHTKTGLSIKERP